MADRKNFTATWLGDGDPNAQMILMFGLRFIKGEAVKVPANLYVEGIDAYGAIRNNPLFAVEEDEDEVVLNDAPEDEDIDALKKALHDLNVPYRANASVKALREALNKATA